MQKLRFGIIGAGKIAQTRTIPGLLNARNAELVAISEIKQELADAAAEKFGAKYAFDAPEKLLACEEVDAVYIATPVVCHAQQAKLAADYGKHVLLEKPIAMNADEAEATVRYCKGKGIKIAAGFMMRYGAHAMNMKRAVDEGRLGQVVTAYARFTAHSPDTREGWRHYKAQSGGGSLMDLGVHCIDLAEYICGSRAVRVAALNDTLSYSYDVEDTSSLLIAMENGMHLVVQSNFNVHNENAVQRLEILGTEGTLFADEIISQVDGGELRASFMNAASDDLIPTFGNMYTREIESFADSVLNDKPLIVPAEDAAHVQRVIEAAYASSETGKFVEIKKTEC